AERSNSTVSPVSRALSRPPSLRLRGLSWRISLYVDGASKSNTGVVYSAPPRSANPWGGCSFMKAMVLKQPADVQRQPLALDDVPVPEPAPGEVRARVQGSGACRTDLHICSGA